MKVLVSKFFLFSNNYGFHLSVVVKKKTCRYKRTTMRSSWRRMTTTAPLHQKDFSLWDILNMSDQRWGVSREDWLWRGFCPQDGIPLRAFCFPAFALQRQESWDLRTSLQQLYCMMFHTKDLEKLKFSLLLHSATFHLDLERLTLRNVGLFTKCLSLFASFLISVSSNVLAEHMLHQSPHTYTVSTSCATHLRSLFSS